MSRRQPELSELPERITSSRHHVGEWSREWPTLEFRLAGRWLLVACRDSRLATEASAGSSLAGAQSSSSGGANTRELALFKAEAPTPTPTAASPVHFQFLTPSEGFYLCATSGARHANTRPAATSCRPPKPTSQPASQLLVHYKVSPAGTRIWWPVLLVGARRSCDVRNNGTILRIMSAQGDTRRAANSAAGAYQLHCSLHQQLAQLTIGRPDSCAVQLNYAHAHAHALLLQLQTPLDC